METNVCYQGDCLEVMKSIPDKSIDMILCDLPYGITACKWDTIIPFEPLWKQYNRIIKDNGAIVLTASQPFTTLLINSNINQYKYSWYWQKERGTGFQFSKYQPLRIIEDVCVFSKNKTIYNPLMIKLDKPYKHVLPRKKSDTLGELKTMKSGENIYKLYEYSLPNNLIRFARDKNSDKKHPTQKPVALFEYLIKTYTNEGDLVLDNCAGSGTTGVACKNTNRNFILIEQDEKYCEVIKERVGCEIIKEI